MPDDKTDSKSRPVTLNEADQAIATFVATLENLIRKAPTTRQTSASTRRRP